MIIETLNDDKSLRINSQNTPSYQGSTMNTFSNRDKKNIKSIIKNHKIQITDSDLSSQDLKLNFNFNKNRINLKHTYDISPESPNCDLKNKNNDEFAIEKNEDLILNDFEDTFSKSKLNLKSCINLTNSNSKNYNFTKQANKTNILNEEEFISQKNNLSLNTKNNTSNRNISNNRVDPPRLYKKHNVSRSIDNSVGETANYRNFNINNSNDYSYDNSLNSKSPSNYSNNKTYSDINNVNNSICIMVTSDIEGGLNKSTSSNNNNFKNSEKTIEKEIKNQDNELKNSNNNTKHNSKSLYKNKINLKLNNKHLLKKSINKQISINISSIHSPDHTAIYRIEKIENHENGEIKCERFKDLNERKTEKENTQKSLIDLQNCVVPINKHLNSISKLEKFSREVERTGSGKLKKLVFVDCVNNNNFEKQHLNNSNINNSLNDRIHRAISNSPNRIVADNSNSIYNESSVRVGLSNNFNNNITIGNSQLNKSAFENFNVFHKDKNDSYCKNTVNSSKSFTNKKSEQNIFNYNLKQKNKTIDNDEDHEINLINNQNNSKNTYLDITDINFHTPIKRKSKSRHNSSDVFAGQIDSKNNKIKSETDNTNINLNNYNPKLNFLKERYGERKFKMLIDLMENSKDLNKTLNDTQKIKSIVGEDYKIAKSFMKNISNEIFPLSVNSPSKI